MKRTIALFFFFAAFFLTHATEQTEYKNRINLLAGASDKIFITQTDFGEIGGYELDFNAQIEYTRLFSSGILKGGLLGFGLGASANISAWAETEYSNHKYVGTGHSFSAYPIIGLAFGELKNIQLLVYPIAFDFVTLDDIDTAYKEDEISKLNYITYKSSILASFQWGHYENRRGFFFGVNLIQGSSGDFHKSWGIEFPLGYKSSFAF